METTPHRGRPRKEYNTSEMPIGQMSSFDLDERIATREPDVIVPVDTPLISKEIELAAFMEEPVTIRIEKSSEKYAPKYIPVAVQGKGAEILHDGKWVPMLYIEAGRVLTTKRKYVEVLVRSKPMDVQTVHEDTNVERPRNEIMRTTRSAHPVTIIRDDNPRGHEWLTQIMAEG